MEGQLGLAELSIISWVSAVEGSGRGSIVILSATTNSELLRCTSTIYVCGFTVLKTMVGYEAGFSLARSLIMHGEGRIWGHSVGFWKQYKGVEGYCPGYTRLVASLIPRLSPLMMGRVWEQDLLVGRAWEWC